MNLEFKKSYHLDLDLEKVANTMVINNFYDIVNSIRYHVERNLEDAASLIQSPLYTERLTVKLSDVIGKDAAMGTLKKATLNLNLTYYWFHQRLLETNRLELWIHQSGLTLNVGGTNFILGDTDFWRDTELAGALAKSMEANQMDYFLKGMAKVNSVTIDADIL